eukprot:1237363-Amphidinium_carterae.1
MLDPLRRETVKQTRESPPTTNGPELLRPDEEPWWPDRPTKDFGEEQVSGKCDVLTTHRKLLPCAL